MIRFILILVVLLGSISSVAQEPEPTNVAVEQGETIFLKAELAVHMGLRDQEIVFGQPRQFRSDSTEQVSIEPLEDASEQTN